MLATFFSMLHIPVIMIIQHLVAINIDCTDVSLTIGDEIVIWSSRSATRHLYL